MQSLKEHFCKTTSRKFISIEQEWYNQVKFMHNYQKLLIIYNGESRDATHQQSQSYHYKRNKLISDPKTLKVL